MSTQSSGEPVLASNTVIPRSTLEGMWAVYSMSSKIGSSSPSRSQWSPRSSSLHAICCPVHMPYLLAICFVQPCNSSTVKGFQRVASDLWKIPPKCQGKVSLHLSSARRRSSHDASKVSLCLASSLVQHDPVWLASICLCSRRRRSEICFRLLCGQAPEACAGFVDDKDVAT